MIVMPAGSTGWFWHCLARETRRIGHLYSPGHQRGPWPWFPYALDNGAFACWDPVTNTFDHAKWAAAEGNWRRLLFWAQVAGQQPRWVIVPDVPGNSPATLQRWDVYSGTVETMGFTLAVAVQDGMTPKDVRKLRPRPEVICVGGSTEFKWGTVEMWAKEFPRVHVLRCNSPTKLHYLEKLGVESTDGTGWNRGDRKQTLGLERFVRARMNFGRVDWELTPFTCRERRDPNQESFI